MTSLLVAACVLQPSAASAVEPSQRPVEPDGSWAVVDSRHDDFKPRAVELGDINGDGIEDFATGGLPLEGDSARTEWLVTLGQARNAPSAPALTSRLRILSTHDGRFPQAVGDLDRDGYVDIAFPTDEGARVAFGRASGTVDLALAGDHALTVLAPTCGATGRESVVSAGDANGDGRNDLAFGGVGRAMIVFTPPAPRAATVNADATNSATLQTPGDGCSWLLPHNDPIGGRRSGIVIGFRTGGRGFIAGVTAPNAPGTSSLEAASKAGRTWVVSVGPAQNMFYVAAAHDYNGDGRQDLNVSVDTQGRTIFAPRLGEELALENAPGRATQAGFDLVIDDQDGDGQPEVLSFGGMHLSRGGVQPLGGTEVGSTVDVEGDGLREVVTLDTDLEVDPDNPGRQVYTTALVTWRSSALARIRATPPEVPPMSHEEWEIYARTGVRPFVDCTVNWWRCPWLPQGTLPQQRFLAARPAERRSQPPGYNGSVTQLAATPEVEADGVVQLLVRTPHGARVQAVPAVSSWRGTAAPVTLTPTSGQAAADEPFTRLTLTLPPEQRALLAGDGRLRLRLAMTATGPGTATHSEQFDLILVSQRTAAVPRAIRELKGSFGIQHLRGGPGPDALFGASGDDTLRGRAGIDSLLGGTGNDRLFGDDGNDTLDGNDGDDQLRGGAGDDNLVETRFGDDSLWGDAGDDVLVGLRGHDTLHGGPGDDVLRGGSGPDDVWCGPGEDIVFVNFGEERARIHGCEHVYEEPGVIHLPCRDGGTPGPETVLGTEGDDRCDGRGGNDDVEGRGGDDTLRGGAGNDRIFGRKGADNLRGGNGDDEIEGGRGRDRLDGGAGDDALNGGYDPDVVHGGAGDDTITARGGGADVIDCGSGLRDVAIVDSQDRVSGCERVDRSGSQRR